MNRYILSSGGIGCGLGFINILFMGGHIIDGLVIAGGVFAFVVWLAWVSEEKQE